MEESRDGNNVGSDQTAVRVPDSLALAAWALVIGIDIGVVNWEPWEPGIWISN